MRTQIRGAPKNGAITGLNEAASYGYRTTIIGTTVFDSEILGNTGATGGRLGDTIVAE
ncbi:MAG: hypothetical protein HY452_00765 [Parcubacteria group bacterium]|nr:hypothetical protein [Parcubacteria group bacterium]